LFGDLGLPTYHVVTGERTDDPSPYKPTDIHPIARIRLSGICLADGRLDHTKIVTRWDQDAQFSSEGVPSALQPPFVRRDARPRSR
jgi:hypothetical protein